MSDDLRRLKELASKAAQECEEPSDWFDPELIDSTEPISSGQHARRFIADASSFVVLRLCEVAEKARQALIALEHARDYIGDDHVLGPPSAYVDCVNAIEALAPAIRHLIAPQEGS